MKMVQKKSHFQYLLIGHDKVSALQILMKADINSRGRQDLNLVRSITFITLIVFDSYQSHHVETML